DQRSIDIQDLNSIFEAARWSPSANNLQPWSYIYAVKATEPFAGMVDCLNESNALWASKASVLVLACTATAKPDGSPHKHADYDLGQSVAHLSIQATTLGLYVHQMGGFNSDRAIEIFQIPRSYVPLSVIALGYLGGPTELPAHLLERELAPRVR